MRFANDGMTDKQNTAAGLVRDFASGIVLDELPDGDTSIQINLRDVEESPTRYIHIRDSAIQVCDTDLGFDVDVVITSSLDAMTRIWYGELDVNAAIGAKRMILQAAPVYSRSVSKWLGISSFTTDNPTLAAPDPPEKA